MPKRPSAARRSRHTAEAEELICLTRSLADSSSMVEDRFWQDAMVKLVHEILAEDEEDAFNTALDTLVKTDSSAWNELADVIESCCETRHFMQGKEEWQLLMIAVPILAWSRYAIPSGPLGRAITQQIQSVLSRHVLAEATKVALVDHLFSPDQLPQGFCNTSKLADSLIEVVSGNGVLSMDEQQLPETKQFLSDTRFVIAAIACPLGHAFFRWQETDGEKEEVETQWRKHASTLLQPVFTGCAYEILLPIAYFAAWREADRQSREYAIRATVSFLRLALNVEPQQICAAIAPCHGRRLEEYRIGFMLGSNTEIVNGVVWPLLDGEDEQTDCAAQIEAVLRDCGLTNIISHDHAFPLDYCDDCGAPLYPNSEGELLHTEVPEETPEQPRHLH